MARSVTHQLRQMGFDDDAIASATVDGRPISEAEPPKQQRKYGRYKSKWERLYALELEDAKREEIILAWDYEPIRLRLTEPGRDAEGKAIRPIFYTPDFAVWLPGKLRFVEVKGHRRTKDVNRYKLARDRFPQFEFQMVAFQKGRFEVVM